MITPRSRLAYLLTIFFLFSGTSRAQEVRPLEPNQPVEREIAGGQTHTYQINLAVGQFMRVVVEQKAINVAVALVAPDSKQVVEVNLVGAMGQESLSHEAAARGEYRVIIRPLAATAPTGLYQVHLEVKAIATAQEKLRIVAERTLAEAVKSSQQGAASIPSTLEKSQQALQTWRELGDSYWEAFTLHLIGNAYSLDRKYDQAVEYYEQALPILRAVKDHRNAGDLATSLGYAYGYLNRWEKAIESFQQALAIRHELKNWRGEAANLSDLGIAHSSLRHYDKAIEYYMQALTISREVKDRGGEGDTLNRLGGLYSTLSNYDKAVEYYEQALAIKQETKNRGGEGVSLVLIGAAYVSNGRDEKALEYLQPGLGIVRETKNQTFEGLALDCLGRAYLALSLYDRAIENLELALTIRRQRKDQSGEAGTLNSLGKVYSGIKRYDKAIPYFDQALLIAHEIQYHRVEGFVLDGLMQAWRAGNQPLLAIFYGKQAVNLYQDMRQNMQTLERDTQQTFLKSKENTYRNLADLLISQGRLPEAEQVIRLLKEDEYFEYIRRDENNSPKADKAALTPEEAALEKRYREIADQLTAFGVERSTLLEKKSRTMEEEQRLAKLEADLAIAGQMFQKFLDGLAAEMGKTSEAGSRLSNLRESQALMEDLRELGRGTVALYTLIGEEKFRVILTTADVQRAYEYPIKAADLNRKVLAFREALQNPRLDPQPLAQELYQILVAPIAKDLKAAKAETLMWSLDGVLRYVPIAALHDGEKYLVERFRNVVFTVGSYARLKDVPSRNWKALGLGVTKAHGERIPALPGVLEEMRGIIKDESSGARNGVLPGTIKLDEQFTQETMLTGLRARPPVVHVASHFQFQPGNETNSALLLGDGSFLSLAQIKSLPNVFGGVELLTLSACNTATGGSGASGKEVEGFGVLAQRQGAKAVVASLWPVADRSTKELMQEFYKLREANAGTTKAEALRQAQLKLLRGELVVTVDLTKREIVHEEDQTANKPLFKADPKKPYSHPYYWAPFILIGNWK